MDWSYYKGHIDRRVRGNKVDLTPLCNSPAVLKHLVTDLARPFVGVQFEKVASPEALGFVLGSAVALKLGKGFIPIRTGGALPTLRRYVAQISFVDYTGTKKALEVNRSLVSEGDRILVVDDVIETGAQAKALVRLIERLGGEVVGISVLGAMRNPKTRMLFDRYNLHAIDS